MFGMGSKDGKAKGDTQRQLGVTWNNLTVKGVSSETTVNENVLSLWNFKQQAMESRGPKQLKTILDKSHGHVSPGEMLLVLGRPGSGCTTLLRMLANKREGYAEIEGDVHFGSMSHKEADQYQGQIVMNAEEEIFFPTLTVGQTMDFVTRMKQPAEEGNDKPTRLRQRDELLETMGIGHTSSTKIGDAYVRGVSGGERKRVSIAEVLATRGSLMCWDNSTRGLDASTALDFTKTLREMTDEHGLTTICTFYQAGNGIFDLFDKILVIDEGKQLFYGPRDQALSFMNDLGFSCEPSANVGDFLTGVCVPKERKILEGFENKFPRTADEIVAAYQRTEIKKSMEKEYDYHTRDDTKRTTESFHTLVQSEKHKSLPKKSALTTSFWTQMKTSTIREAQVIWGDKPTLIIRQLTMLLQALISGSLFYMASPDSVGLFIKGGAIFVSVLYPALTALGLTYDSFTGRPVMAKHKRFALHHPASYCLSQIVVDIPFLLLLLTHFSLIIYFMVGLKMTAGAFFIFYFTLFSVSMCTNAFFRWIGSAFPNFEAASKVSGFAVSIFATYVGYQITKPQMKPWFKWLIYLNPLSWAFEAIFATEFHNTEIPCFGPNLVPTGPGYNDSNLQACTGVTGAPRGQPSLTGDQYLQALQFSHSHVWRNIGIIWAYWVLFVSLTIFCTSRWNVVADASRSLLVPRETLGLVKAKKARDDEEAQASEKSGDLAEKQDTTSSSSSSTTDQKLIKNTSVFTWKNLTYTVSTGEGDRVLLDDVYGYVKPGMLGALMGSSGAGKTTLMDVLAQRKTEGTIKGSILVDGRPLSVSFQRSAGYCEQLDVHERLSTVREALEFAALLRQSRKTPKEEKLQYVDSIIALLGLEDIEHTLIGKPGAGLSIEQQKRVTIGVELVSKPEIVLFLDEPTSGLDGQAAFATVRFLRKLADVGQAVLVVIHQPSASLFAEFDTLLLLQKGGKMAYFGDIGHKAATVKDYFERNGVPCPDHVNPAEHMIDVVSGSLSKEKDWHSVWKESPEHKAALERLDAIVDDAASKPPATEDDGHEFAASQWEQTKILTQRMNKALYRDTDYVNNRIFLHIGSALFNGFSFWMVGDSVSDLQLRLFALFNYIFIAPGVFAQLQPLFLERRDIYLVREKKSKTYSWVSFCTSQIVSEFPYLVIAAVLYFSCFYFTVGFPLGGKAASSFFVMLMYQFLYTGIGQFVAAYAPNAVFASLVNPLIVSTLVSFCGVLTPYSQITAVWRYTLYYVNPFSYLLGALLVFTTFDAKVNCNESELAIFNTPAGQTCRQYLSAYISSPLGMRTNLLNPDATSDCRVCQYRVGSDYLYTLNLKDYYYGWRDAAIVVLFCFSSYSLVYVLMKLRTKQSKKAGGD